MITLPPHAWLDAVIPGAGTAELKEKLKNAKLRSSDPALLGDICIEHAIERAEEFFFVISDDELEFRDGDYFWTMFRSEIEAGLRGSNIHPWRVHTEYAATGFIGTFNTIRRLRIGHP